MSEARGDQGHQTPALLWGFRMESASGGSWMRVKQREYRGVRGVLPHPTGQGRSFCNRKPRFPLCHWCVTGPCLLSVSTSGTEGTEADSAAKRKGISLVTALGDSRPQPRGAPRPHPALETPRAFISKRAQLCFKN